MPQQGNALSDKSDNYVYVTYTYIYSVICTVPMSPADQDGKEDKDEKGEDKDNDEEKTAAGEEGEDGEEEEDRSALLPAACFLWWTGFATVWLKRCHFPRGECIFSMLMHFERFKSRIVKGHTQRSGRYTFYLVGGLEHFSFSQKYWEFHHPN